MNVVCKGGCAKDGKDGAKLFVQRSFGKIEGHEKGHGKLEILIGKLKLDASEGGVAVLACDEASDSGGEKKALTGIDAAKQSVLLNVSDDICRINVVHFLYVLVLRKGAAVADTSENTVAERHRLSAGGCFIRNVRDGDCLLAGQGAPFFLA